MKKIFVYFIFILLLSTFVVAAPGEAVGTDPIFELMGHDKPSDWGDMTRQQKFSYLQNLGIYPGKGNRYQGTIASLDPYFEKLGLTEPDNWYDMSFEERKAYIATSKGSNEVTTEYKEEFVMPSSFEIISLICALIIGFASLFAFKSKYRKYTAKFTFYALPLILLALSLIQPERELFAFMGNIAEKLLIFLMFVKPISKIFSSKIFTRAVLYRKELGVASFWFFLFHAGGLIFVRNLTHTTDYSIPFLFWGLLAGFGMLILGLTSNNFSLKYFKKRWKVIQYLAYPTFLLVLAHSGLFEQGTYTKLLIIGGIYIVLKILEFKKIKFRKNVKKK